MHGVIRREVPIYGRYVVASAVALGIDLSLFWALLGGGVSPAAAAAIGYSAGIGAHWLISSRLVFVGRVYRGGKHRRRQKLGFVLSTLPGLGVTVAIVSAGSWLGFDPRVAKLIAMAASFNLVFLIRRTTVFG